MLANVFLKSDTITYREWLTYDFEVRETNFTILALKWDIVSIPIKIEVNSETTSNHIRNQLRSDASFKSEGWSNAVQYCLDAEINYDEALKCADQAINSDKNFKNLIIKAELQLVLDKQTELEETKRESLEHGSASDLFNYIFTGRGDDKFGFTEEVIQQKLKQNPKIWEAHYSAGLYHLNVNDHKKAKKYLEKALDLGNDNVKGWISRDLERLINNK